MTTLISRALSVTYNGVTIGGASTTLLLDGPVLVTIGPDNGTLFCSFVLRNDTDSDSDFAALISTTETALRTPRKKLEHVQAGSDLHEFDPAFATGFNHMPDLQTPGDPGTDSGRSKRYNLTVFFDLPADVYGTKGREKVLDIDYDCSRITRWTLSGVFTSTATPLVLSARAVYEAARAGLISDAIATFPGGTLFDIPAETLKVNDTDTIVEFSLSSKEIIFEQSGGTLDHPAIVEPAVFFKRIGDWPGDSPGRIVSRPAQIIVTYETCVDKTVTKDLKGLWLDTIRPFLLSQARRAWGGGQVALMSDSPTLDSYNNRITAELRLMVTNGFGLLEYQITTEIKDDPGEVNKPVGHRDPLAYLVYQGPQKIFRVISERFRRLGQVVGGGVQINLPGGGPAGFFINFEAGEGDEGELRSTSRFRIGPGGVADLSKEERGGNVQGGGAGAKGGGGGGSLGPGSYGAEVTTTAETPLLLGDPGTSQIAVTDVTITTVQQFRKVYKPPKGGGGSGGTSVEAE